MLDTAAILAWGEPRLRDLPWRATRDPWQILVAEVMLHDIPETRDNAKVIEAVKSA